MAAGVWHSNTLTFSGTTIRPAVEKAAKYLCSRFSAAVLLLEKAIILSPSSVVKILKLLKIICSLSPFSTFSNPYFNTFAFVGGNKSFIQSGTLGVTQRKDPYKRQKIHLDEIFNEWSVSSVTTVVTTATHQVLISECWFNKNNFGGQLCFWVDTELVVR